MVPSFMLPQWWHTLLSRLQNDLINTVLFKVCFFFFFLSVPPDNMPENAGQDGGVLCSRVGTERHWQGNDAEMQHI